MTKRDADGDIDSTPVSSWMNAIVSSSMSWSIVTVAPHTLVSVLESCSSSTPFVFALQSGTYDLAAPLVFARQAPCIVKAEGAEPITFRLRYPNLSPLTASGSPKKVGPIVHVRGGNDVVFQGIHFDATSSTMTTSTPGRAKPGATCVVVDGTARVCFSECHFLAPWTLDAIASSRGATEMDSACIDVRETGGLFISQCEFGSGDVAIFCAPCQRSTLCAPAPRKSKSKKKVKGTAASAKPESQRNEDDSNRPAVPTITVEDCGFASRETAMRRSRDESGGADLVADAFSPGGAGVLHRGIWCGSDATAGSNPPERVADSDGTTVATTAAPSPVTVAAVYHVVVDHSNFEDIVGAFLETCASTTTGVTISVAHSTVARCGGGVVNAVDSSPCLILRGQSRLHMDDCSVESCGAMILCHESASVVCETSVKSSVPVVSLQKKESAHNTNNTYVPFFARQLVVQDRASATISKCEWMADLEPVRSAPHGEGSRVHHPDSAAAAPSKADDISNRCEFSFAVLLSTGKVSLDDNLFRLEAGGDVAAAMDDSTGGTIAASPSSDVICLIVDGSAAPRITNNTFHCGECPSAAHPRGVLLGLWHDTQFDKNTFSGSLDAESSFGSLEEHPAAIVLVQPHAEVTFHQWKSDALDGSPAGNATAAASARPVRGAAVAGLSPAPAPTSAEPAVNENQAELKSTIQRLEAQVKALQEQIRMQHVQAPISAQKLTAGASRKLAGATRGDVHPPAQPKSRPTSARPSRPTSARNSSTSRPSSARPSRTASSAASRREPSPPEKVVRIGHHKWNLHLIKGFFEGSVPLSAVRRPPTPADGSPTKRPPGDPSSIYDEWKQRRAERQRAEEAVIAAQQRRLEAARRKLTPQEQKEHIARIHAESVEHLRNVRNRWEEEQRCRFIATERPLSLRKADEMLEAAGDFQERLAKDLRDREERRARLLARYAPQHDSVRRSPRHIEAYASSMHKAHHDPQLVKVAQEEAGCSIHVAPPRDAYPRTAAPRRTVKLEDQIVYCNSLYASHKDEALAERAAAVAGNDVITRVASRSASRGR